MQEGLRKAEPKLPGNKNEGGLLNIQHFSASGNPPYDAISNVSRIVFINSKGEKT